MMMETNEGREVAVSAGSADLTPMERMFASIVDLATNPDVDAGKMQALVNLQMQMMDYDKREVFNKAKIAALQEMPTITKAGAITNKGGGVQSRYSRFEDIMKVVKPILQKHGLAISFNIGNTNAGVTVQPILSHINGHVEVGHEMWLPLDTTGSKNGTQGAGSAAAYGKRHSAKAMLNIVEDGVDDDGRSLTRELEPWQEALKQNGAEMAARGAEAYTTWVSGLSNMHRGWLIDSKNHAAFKAKAGL